MPKVTQPVLSKTSCADSQSHAPCFPPGPVTLLCRTLGSVTRERGVETAGRAGSSWFVSLTAAHLAAPAFCSFAPSLLLTIFPALSQQPCLPPGWGARVCEPGGHSSVHCNEAEGGPSRPGRGLARVGWREGTPKGGNLGWEPWNWINSADPGDWEINHVLKRLFLKDRLVSGPLPIFLWKEGRPAYWGGRGWA